MSTIKLFLCLLCLAYFSSNELYRRDLLIRILKHSQQKPSRFTITEIANNELGVKELTCHNDGARVEAYLSVVKLKKGAPWCAAFVSWVYQKAGFPKPRSGWSPDLFPRSRLARSALPGDVIGIYFPDLKRVAHVGIVISQKGDYIYTTEGNTTLQGGRDGDGVFRKVRHVRTIHSIADWYTERRVSK
ncbi:MAG: CHAP domain-containing protein [Pedobacter sp.]|uniref:CHAP domain-containing protein n=1 Tax=Pedobacter sp. TaxID=1411316 RepID=UPI0033971C02